MIPGNLSVLSCTTSFDISMRSSNDIFNSFLNEKRSIFIYQDIDAEIASRVATSIFYLDSLSHEEICLYINSYGGTVSDGFFAIYDAMMAVESPIKTICIGHAYSAAAELLAAGTPGRRCAFSNSQIMIHDVQVEDVTGPKKEVKKELARILALNKRGAELLSKHTGKSISEIESDCEEDLYMSAKEALDYGIIDEIIRPVKNSHNIRSSKQKSKKVSKKTICRKRTK